MITQTLKLNLIPGQVLPRVNVSQYDAGTRTLQMLLYNGDQAFNISAGLGGFVQGTKPDRTGFQYAATVTEGSNVVTLVITQQMTAVSGEVTCELVIANGNDRIATVNFILYVEPAALADDTVISETELPLIEEAAELAQRIDGIAADVEADADRAEAAVEHYPYIGANGNWYVFDLQTEQFVDTTIAATGPQGPTGPTGPTGQTGPTGPTGNGIVSITKTGTSGLVDTYTITFTDGTTTTFTVTNGQDGQGSGDMTKAVYDSTNAVADAGGIVAYVASHSGAGTLAGLTDVALSTLADGQSLIYDATAQKWLNGSVAYSSLSGKPTLGTAAAKDSTNAVTSGSTDLVESGAVYTEIQTLTNKVANEIATRAKVSGHNLLPNYAQSQTLANSIQYTLNADGSIKLNGTANADGGLNFVTHYKGLPSGQLIFSKGTANDNAQIYLNLYNGNTFVRQETALIGVTEYAFNNNYSGYDSVDVGVYVENGKSLSNVTFYPMIRLATDESSDYEPYSMTNREMTPYVQAITNPNLLDNPWFTVNQRGNTSGTPSELTRLVDRWTMALDFGSYSVSDEGLALNASSHSITVYQGAELSRTRELFNGKPHTLSIDMTVRSKGNVGISIGYNQDNSWVDATYPSRKYITPDEIPTGRSIVSATLITPRDNFTDSTGFLCWLYIEQGWDITIHSVKMELGSVSTLAMDTAPNYATELLKCQRYFQRLKKIYTGDWTHFGFVQGYNDTAGAYMIPTPVEMRTQPTVTFSGTVTVVFNDSTAGHITAFGPAGYSTSNLIVGDYTATASKASAFGRFYAENDANTYIDISADL